MPSAISKPSNPLPNPPPRGEGTRAEPWLNSTSELRLAEGRPAKAYSVERIREEHERAYLAWAEDEDELLRDLLKDGYTVAQIAGRLQRQRSVIRSRIKKLGLEEIEARNGL